MFWENGSFTVNESFLLNIVEVSANFGVMKGNNQLLVENTRKLVIFHEFPTVQYVFRIRIYNSSATICR